MAEFNINNSKIEQLSDTGDNTKVVGNSGPVVVAGQNATQAAGAESEAKSGGESFIEKAVSWVKKWFAGSK